MVTVLTLLLKPLATRLDCRKYCLDSSLDLIIKFKLIKNSVLKWTATQAVKLRHMECHYEIFYMCNVCSKHCTVQHEAGQYDSTQYCTVMNVLL